MSSTPRVARASVKPFHVDQSFDAESEAGRYLIACARIRNLAVGTLVQRVLDVVMQDQLVLAILDDDSKEERHRGDHRFKEVA